MLKIDFNKTNSKIEFNDFTEKILNDCPKSYLITNISQNNIIN